MVEYTYANGVRHRCLSTTANNIFGGEARRLEPGELYHGVKFEGTDGWIYVTRGKIEASRPEILSEPLTSKKVQLYVSNDHMQNFFDCVRSRKPPICEAEIGHRSVSVCHLGVIALRLGRKLSWDPEKEVFVDDKEADGTSCARCGSRGRMRRFEQGSGARNVNTGRQTAIHVPEVVVAGVLGCRTKHETLQTERTWTCRSEKTLYVRQHSWKRPSLRCAHALPPGESRACRRANDLEQRTSSQVPG